jgi:hypothetical protein
MNASLFTLDYEGRTTGEIADQLMQSLDKPDPETERIWGEEAVRRLAAIDAGHSRTYSAEEVFGQD